MPNPLTKRFDEKGVCNGGDYWESQNIRSYLARSKREAWTKSRGYFG